MKKIIGILILLMTLVSCTRKPVRSTSKVYSYVFYVDTVPKIEPYLLTIQDNDSIIKFDYIHLEDSNKAIYAQYIRKNELLKFSMDQYHADSTIGVKTNSEEYLTVGVYDISDYIGSDASGPILFDTEYGILLIKNVLGPDFVFLSDSISTKRAVEIKEIIR